MQPSTTSTNTADRYLAIQVEMLPGVPNYRLADELAMADDNAARSDAIPQDAAYLAAIREEIARRGLTEADVYAAREDRFAQLKANSPHTCCAACRRAAAS